LVNELFMGISSARVKRYVTTWSTESHTGQIVNQLNTGSAELIRLTHSILRRFAHSPSHFPFGQLKPTKVGGPSTFLRELLRTKRPGIAIT
jgi:hypothetical protein